MYTTKKEADAHDKMLDIAERLTDFIQAAETFDVEEAVLEELALYLARNRMDIIQILKGAKPKPPAKAEAPAPPPKPQKEKKKPARKR
jgi:dsDNA-binding SOS-regulon protein